jgi:hypothetical protein
MVMCTKSPYDLGPMSRSAMPQAWAKEVDMESELKMDDWPEVTEAELQHWLDTSSPDYEMRHQWGNDWMVCYRRGTDEAFAYQRAKPHQDGRCFVHPDFLHQVRT